MSTHTWHYKRDTRSYEEVRDTVIDRLTTLIERIKNYNYDSKDYEIKLIERQIQVVKKNLCQKAVYYRLAEITEVHNGVAYIECEFHDSFRVGFYPEDKLTSYQETLDFIKNYELKHNCKVELWKREGSNKTRLEEFWEKYPDGLITFG